MKLPGKKALTATALAGAIGLGSLGVAALNPLGVAGAQESGATSTTRADGDRAGRLSDKLQARVQDGTLTQEQADKIEQRLRSRAEDRRGPGRERLRAAVKRSVQTAADTIGITPEALRDELKAGKSISQVATENGVDPQQVVDTLVGNLNAKVDQAVADGKLSQERADAVKAKAPQRVAELVDRTWGQRPQGN